MNSSLSVCHKYAARGWPIFPLRPLGKEPLGQLVPNGLHDATTDAATIEQWWAVYPDANIGMRTGAVSGILVVDVDAGKGGWDSVDHLEERHGSFPLSPIVATGGGGAHVYFRHPGGVVPNSTGRIAPGIDVRGDGGYVVAPPSGHVSGAAYTWSDGCTPEDVPLADVPEWLLPSITRRDSSPQLQEDELITEGGRNDRLMRIGAAFRRYGLTESEIAVALHVVNKTRCRPQLDEAEVGRIAASVARYEPDAGNVVTFGGSKMKRRKAGGFRIVAGQVVAS